MAAQPLSINQQTFNALNAAVNSGDYIQYYSLLAQAGDRYASLALGVVQSDTFAGKVALRFAANMAGAPISGGAWAAISGDLMRADWTYGDTLHNPRSRLGHALQSR